MSRTLPLELKPAVLADTRIILDFQQKAASRLYKPMMQEAIEVAIKNDVVYLIRETVNTLFVGVIIYKRTPGCVKLEELVIDEAFRGQGIGSAVLELILMEVRSRGFTNIELWTHPDNRAVNLYERHGYKRVRMSPDFYGDGQPRMLMRRETEQCDT